VLQKMLHYTKTNLYVMSAPSLFKILIKSGEEITINEESDTAQATHIEITVEAKARLNYIIKKESPKENFVIHRIATVHRDAHITWSDTNKNCSTNSEIITKLVEPGAQATTYGIFYGEDAEQFTISHTTEHLAPDTHSRMETRGVLDGASRANIQSLIKIHPNMSGCSGHERIDTLLMSTRAHIDAVPNLEIGNNDVQCTHAVTTTRLSPEKLFYLAGRGIGESKAKKMLVEAHLAGVVEKNILST
jgi:Fe-S cluster assembly protein SufD